MVDSSDKCAEALLELVPRILSGLRRSISSRRGVDLTVPQFRTLAFIGRNPGCTVSDTATDLGLSTPSASRLVDALIVSGLARRKADVEDRRRVSLSLTAAGRRKHGVARRRARTHLSNQLEELSTGEREVLLEALGSLRTVFTEDANSGTTRT